MITEYLTLALLIAASGGWAYLWIRTYDPYTLCGLILHSILFSIISLMLLFIGLSILFSSADETYSASNKSALGLLGLIYSAAFLLCCLAALVQTIGDYLDRKHKE